MDNNSILSKKFTNKDFFHIIKGILFAVLGSLPFWIVIAFTGNLVEALLFFCGVGSFWGYVLLKKDILTAKNQRNIFIIGTAAAVIICIAGECVSSYVTLMKQFISLGYSYSYGDLIKEIPLAHLLGYYIGIDSLNADEVGNNLVAETVWAVWKHVIFGVILSASGIIISMKLKGLFKRRKQSK